MDFHLINTINNTVGQKARAAVGLEKVRAQDPRHTFTERARYAGVPEENRSPLLGHAIEEMPHDYISATMAKLVQTANKVQLTVDRTSLLRVVNG